MDAYRRNRRALVCLAARSKPLRNEKQKQKKKKKKGR
jgi:hypothetical protein